MPVTPTAKPVPACLPPARQSLVVPEASHRPIPACGYSAQRAALSPRRAGACRRATVDQGRGEWVAERNPLSAMTVATARAQQAKVRHAVCNPAVRVADPDAERWVEAAGAPITGAERWTDSTSAAERKKVDGAISTAQDVRALANLVGGYAEGLVPKPIGHGLSLVRHMAGAASEEVFAGDGTFSPADATYELGAWGLNEGLSQVTGGLVGKHTADMPLEAALAVAKLVDAPRELATGEALGALKRHVVPKDARDREPVQRRSW